jgi:hypothetical protein
MVELVGEDFFNHRWTGWTQMKEGIFWQSILSNSYLRNLRLKFSIISDF